MDEILQKLFGSDVLSEDSKAAITESFKAYATAYLTEERSKIEAEVNTRLTKEFVDAREELVESLNSKIDKMVNAEFDELKGDIEQYRDLEVELAEKLVEEKELLAVRFGTEMDELVEKLDLFLEQRVAAEFEELHEDIIEVKRLGVGRKIMEAFGEEFKLIRKDDTGKIERELAETLDKLADSRKLIADMEKSRINEAKQSKIDELLTPLSGSTREQMKLILNNVSIEKLDEAYKVYLGRILKESVVPGATKLTEAVTVQKSVKVFTGNEEVLEEAISPVPSSALSRMRQLAGLA